MLQWHLFLEILVVALIVRVYTCLRGKGIFQEAHQESPGILAGSPGSRLESLLEKTDAYAPMIVIVAAVLCALSGVVIAVSRGAADASPVFCLIAISGLLCRSALPLPAIASTISESVPASVIFFPDEGRGGGH